MGIDDLTPEEKALLRQDAKRIVGRSTGKNSNIIPLFPGKFFKDPETPKPSKDTKRTFYQAIEYHLPLLTIFGWGMILLVVVIITGTWHLIHQNQANTAKIAEAVQKQQVVPSQQTFRDSTLIEHADNVHYHFGPITEQARMVEAESKELCQIKADIKRDGKKFYYLKGDSEYKSINVVEKNGDRLFCEEREAVKAGFERAHPFILEKTFD